MLQSPLSPSRGRRNAIASAELGPGTDGASSRDRSPHCIAVVPRHLGGVGYDALEQTKLVLSKKRASEYEFMYTYRDEGHRHMP